MATAPSELPTIDRAVMEYESSRRLPDEAFNKLVFAVVGHTGSGTSVVANQLSNLLFDTKVGEGAFEAEILKARDVIAAWATKKALAASRTRLSPRGGSCCDCERLDFPDPHLMRQEGLRLEASDPPWPDRPPRVCI